MRKRLAAFLLLFLCLCLPAFATTGTYMPAVSGVFTDYSNATIGTSAVLIVPANNARKYLVIENVSGVNMGCAYFSTPVIGNAGTITLVPTGSWTFDGNFIYSGAIYCIAASGSNNVVVALEGN